MRSSQPTSHSLLERAAAGSEDARSKFARIYDPVLRAYFQKRWVGSARLADVEDAVQDVFFDCFRPDGVLERVADGSGERFRPFLYGVARVVALRIEEGRARGERPLEPRDPALDRGGREDSPSRAFDRSWARAILTLTLERLEEQADRAGDGALERVRILEERFDNGRPIREIARRWETDVARLHRQYGRVREEFRECLRQVMAEENGSIAPSDQELHELLLLIGPGS